MKRILALVAIVALLLCSCGSKPEKIPDINSSYEPSAIELELIKPFIPQGMTIKNSRRVDTDPPFVFVGAWNEKEYILQLMVFKFEDSKITKLYNFESVGGEDISFEVFEGVNYWGQSLWGSIVCPVNIYFGGNDWASSFTKFFFIKDGELTEPEFEMETFTAISGLEVVGDKTLVRVFDPRFQFFDELCHACSPGRSFLFDYDQSKGKFVDVTPSYPNWTKDQIEDVKKYADAEVEADMVGSYAISIYIQAEAGGLVDEYIQTINKLIQKKQWIGDDKVFIDKVSSQIGSVWAKKDKFSTLLGQYDDDPKDIRFHRMKLEVREIKN